MRNNVNVDNNYDRKFAFYMLFEMHAMNKLV